MGGGEEESSQAGSGTTMTSSVPPPPSTTADSSSSSSTSTFAEARNSAENEERTRLLPPSVMEVKAPISPPPRGTPLFSGGAAGGAYSAITPGAPPVSPQPQTPTNPSSNPASPGRTVDTPVIPPSTPPPSRTTSSSFPLGGGGGNERPTTSETEDDSLPAFARNKPVLSTAVTGSLAGFALGLLFGSPSTGALVGGGLGAVVSSRDDEVGAKAREMGTEGLRKVNKLTHQLAETETGVKLRTNLSDVMKRAEEVDSSYNITSTGKRAVERAVSATGELNRTYHIDDRIYTSSTKFAETVMEKIKQTNPPPVVVDSLSTARKAAGDLDSTLGVTDSLKRTMEKLKVELNVSSPTSSTSSGLGSSFGESSNGTQGGSSASGGENEASQSGVGA